MPVYTYSCQSCGMSSDHCVPYVKRQEPQVCPGCGALAEYAYVDGRAPLSTMNRVRPRRDDGRMIWDERQVTSEKGENWRDEGTNRRPGGAGSKIYFH